MADENLTDHDWPSNLPASSSELLASPFFPDYTFDGPFEGEQPDLRIDPKTHNALAAGIEKDQEEMEKAHQGSTSRGVSSSQFLSSSSSTTKENIFARLPDAFPPFLPAPTDIPIRLPCQEAQLAELDNMFNRKKHAKKGGALSATDETRNRELGKGYASWIDECTPYVKSASTRLQAVMGERNDMEFELPEYPLQRSPLRDITTLLTDLERSRPAMSPALKRVWDTESGTKQIKRARSAAEFDHATSSADNLFHEELCRDDSPVGGLYETLEGLGGKIDKETGRGLREYLMKMGEEHGMTVQVCDSITLLDFTPETMFELPNVKLMKHYQSGEGWGIEVREANLPSNRTDPTTGAITTSYERWIWFYITAPMVDITSFEDPSKIAIPPADFPNPVPQSWVVFALPLAHCTKYDTVTETELTSDNPSKLTGGRKGVNLDPPSPNAKILCHRRDYDLSFSGLPIFEFSQKPPGSLEGWYKWSVGNNILKMKSIMNPSFNGYWEGENGRFLGGSQVPDYGDGADGWWATMFATAFKDVVCWEKMKRSMGRGKMRIVIRWKDDGKARVKKPENEFEKALSAGVTGLGIQGADLPPGVPHGHNLFAGMRGNRRGGSAPSQALSNPSQVNFSHPSMTSLMPPPPSRSVPDPGQCLQRPQGPGLTYSINATSFSMARSDAAAPGLPSGRTLRRVQPFVRPPGEDFDFGGPKPEF
ncbi:hypothetical protein BJ875DRAFT_521997 [Amylocarpus encephaloides]|uniref:Uncharacterized protein n=1 Tax=Amylocarpus encephaloides TaxID=45428 RepID=A0A9P7YAS5_9HELO|nr:hypothetical protein BJ875DRAFT_521997 [Amylocarpus encephaloides]